MIESKEGKVGHEISRDWRQSKSKQVGFLGSLNFEKLLNILVMVTQYILHTLSRSPAVYQEERKVTHSLVVYPE